MTDFLNINFKKGKDTKYGKMYKGYIDIEKLIEQLKGFDGKYVNFILGYSEKADKYYMKIDDWKPNQEEIVKFKED